MLRDTLPAQRSMQHSGAEHEPLPAVQLPLRATTHARAGRRSCWLAASVCVVGGLGGWSELCGGCLVHVWWGGFAAYVDFEAYVLKAVCDAVVRPPSGACTRCWCWVLGVNYAMCKVY